MKKDRGRDKMEPGRKGGYNSLWWAGKGECLNISIPTIEPHIIAQWWTLNFSGSESPSCLPKVA